MNLRISSKPAAFAASSAMTARAFCDMAMNAGVSGGAACLSVILGAAMAVPVLLAFLAVARGGALPARKGLEAALLGLGLTGTARTMSVIVRSAGYLALDRASPVVLTLPAALAMLWAVTRNGDGIGYSAMLWVRIFPVFAVIIAAMQFPYYRPQWLRPMLGCGWGAIIANAIGTAGGFCSIGGIWLVMAPSEGGGKPVKGILVACAAAAGTAALLLFLRLMMMPPVRPGSGFTWQMRLDSLLTNGRAPLYLQMPMIAAWYAGLLHLLACAGFTAAALAQRLIPALDGRACAAAAALCASVLCASGFSEGRLTEWLYQWQYVVLAVASGLAAAAGGIKRCAGAWRR